MFFKSYKNHSSTELRYTNNPTAQVQMEFNPHQLQNISSTKNISLKIPPSGIEYSCFQTYGIKTIELTKVIESILSIVSFEHKCVITKGVLQTEQRKGNFVTIEVYQYLSNSSLYEHRFLENIKKL